MRSGSLAKVYLLIAATCMGLFAQANQGSITGTVRDQTGAVLANAVLEIRNTETNSPYRGGTSETGNFLVPVPAGTYEISVSMPGFKKFVQTGVPVIEGQASRRDIQLEVGQVTETLTVTDNAPLLKTEGGDISYRVTTQLANQIPVLQMTGLGGPMGNIRNPISMASLLPGVSVQTSVFENITINGLPSNSQTIMIEGQDATGTLWRGVSMQRSQGGVDAIEAMQVQTSNFAAEFGKAGGGVINFAMKSGTNKYHGSAYDYMANEFLNAGSPNTDYAWTTGPTAPSLAYKSGQHVRNKLRRQDYGGTFGGPIKIPKLYDGQDKSFFFLNFEQFRQTNGFSNSLETVPTDAFRNGDFSNARCTAYNPSLANPCTLGNLTQNGVTPIDGLNNPVIYGGLYDPSSYVITPTGPARTLYPNNQAPVTSFDRVSLAILNQFPRATNANMANNYNIPFYTQYRTTTIPSIKLDHNLSPTMRISGYWGVTLTRQDNGNGFLATEFPWTAAQPNPYDNHTIRINFDYTMTPTLILHLGAGYFYQKEPNVANLYDQSKIGLPAAGQPNAYFDANSYPTITGLTSGALGSGFGGGIGAGFNAIAWEQKPTANANLTWVKGNHNLKFGGEMTLEGYITHNKWRANGNFAFSANQTGNPWEQGQAGLNFAVNPTGSAFASFMFGGPSSMSLTQNTYTKLGSKAFAFFVQDNWKVTPKLTIEYGLRYDYQTYLSEQYGRLASASWSTFNPTVGKLGGTAYAGGGACSCPLSSNYPYAFGPRANLSYQITPKTVFRAGFGVTYNVVQSPAGLNFSVGDFYPINNAGYGLSALSMGMQGGNVFYPGNPYGNTEIVWPSYDAGRLPVRTADGLPPSTPFNTYHANSRPARITQWSIGLQREVLRNLVIEASYVGNRGAWFYSPLFDTMSINSLGEGQLARYGLDINNAADRALLTNTTIGSATAINRGFGLPYEGFPLTQQVRQAIRPVPQWGTVNPYLGPNRGNTYYDALQFQVTKRYSHNLDLTANVTWAHGMVLGVSSDSDFFISGRPAVKDPFNREQNKQLNQNVPPLKTVISGTYTTPRFGLSSDGWQKYASVLVRDWQFGVVLQYQSGQLIGVPNSNNQLTTQLSMALVPAGGTTNPWNTVPGVGYFKQGFDPNSSNVDFRQYSASVVNGATVYDPNASSYLAGGLTATGTCPTSTCAWSNPPAGQWGATAPYLEGYRWRRRPSEAFNIGRNFRFGRENRFVLNVRAEFQNVMNRMFYSAPSSGAPQTSVITGLTQGGMFVPTGGYGVVNTFNGAGASPRSGVLVGRFTF